MTACKEALVEIDFFGLLLIAASLALILLPLGLAPKSPQGWDSPSMVSHISIQCCSYLTLVARNDSRRSVSNSRLPLLRSPIPFQTGLSDEMAYSTGHSRRMPYRVLRLCLVLPPEYVLVLVSQGSIDAVGIS